MSTNPSSPPAPGDPGARGQLRWETYFNVDPRRQDPSPEPDPLQEHLQEAQQRLDAVEAGQRVSPEQLTAIREAVAAALQASADLSPRIILPPRETMDVILINAHDADRLEEYHSDETRSAAVLGGITGGLLGQLSTLSVTKAPPVHALVLLVMLGVAAAYCWMDVRRVRDRIAAVKTASFEHYRRANL